VTTNDLQTYFRLSVAVEVSIDRWLRRW